MEQAQLQELWSLELEALQGGGNGHAPREAELQAPSHPPESFVDQDASLLYIAVDEYEEVAAKANAVAVMSWLHDVHVQLDMLCNLCPVTKVYASGPQFVLAASDSGGVSGAELLLAYARAAMLVMAQRRAPSGAPVTLRCGLHRGLLVEGIVGVLALRCSVYGTTAHVAQQLQRSCPPNALQMSGDAYESLAERVAWQAKGVLPLQGGGKLQAYVVHGAQMLAAVQADGGPKLSLLRFGMASGAAKHADAAPEDNEAGDVAVPVLADSWLLCFQGAGSEAAYLAERSAHHNLARDFVLYWLVLALALAQASSAAWLPPSLLQPPNSALQLQALLLLACPLVLALALPREYRRVRQAMCCFAICVSALTNVLFCNAALALPEHRVSCIMTLQAVLLNTLPMLVSLTFAWHLGMVAVLAPVGCYSIVRNLQALGRAPLEVVVDLVPHAVVGVALPCFLTYALERAARVGWQKARERAASLASPSM